MVDEIITKSNSDKKEVDIIQRALTTLHLPLRSVAAAVQQHQQYDQIHDHQSTGIASPCLSKNDSMIDTKFPSVTILVCADFDLKSAAALAEYALLQQQKTATDGENDEMFFNANSIDLIIAVGPSTGSAELLKYYQGSMNKLKYLQNRSTKSSRYRNYAASHNNHHLDCAYATKGQNDTATTATGGLGRSMWCDPFFRSKEESAALEGLMTAALSQLESIVCRVVYCPGYYDPISIVQPQPPNRMKRLTPHSRNVHQQYLPLAPGLGCAGLFYLDHTDQLIEHYIKRNHFDLNTVKNTTTYPNSSNNNSNNSAENDEDSESSEQEDGTTLLSDQIRKLLQFPGGYYPALEKLLQLAPQTKNPEVLFGSNNNRKGQSILITHYVDSHALIEGDKSLPDDDDDVGNFDDFYDQSDQLNDRRGCSTSVNVSDVIDETNFDDDDNDIGPWPNGHNKFLNSTTARQSLCFEIATGLSYNYHKPEWIPPSTKDTGTDGSSMKGGVLFPGSLRDHGEFCIVHLSLCAISSSSQTNSAATSICRYGWEVQDVQFHTVK